MGGGFGGLNPNLVRSGSIITGLAAAPAMIAPAADTAAVVRTPQEAGIDPSANVSLSSPLSGPSGLWVTDGARASGRADLRAGRIRRDDRNLSLTEPDGDPGRADIGAGRVRRDESKFTIENRRRHAR